jgi:L-aminopeptidase/D-esterase-like protein
MRKTFCVIVVVAFLSTWTAGRSSGQSGSTNAVHSVPTTSFTGPTLNFDFPGLEIGVAEYEEGPTGTTVFYFPKGATGVVEVRGGWPGTVNTDGLRLGYEDTSLDAVTFAGGSYYGLEVSGGVADDIRLLRERTAPPNAVPGRSSSLAPAHVVAAIVFDLGGRFNTIHPDADLGRAAFENRRPGWFPLGAHGAGRMTSQGGPFGERAKSGQGAAFRQIGPTKLAVFGVMNGGAIVDRNGNVVVENHSSSIVGPSIADHFKKLLESGGQQALQANLDQQEPSGFSRSTNLFLVVTNQKMSWAELQRLAVQVETSLARAIQPFNTRGDGDVLYAVSTQEVDNSDLTAEMVNLYAGEVAWDAVLSSVPPRPVHFTTQVKVDANTLDLYAGDYEFGANAALRIRREGDHLVATATGARAIYGFAPNKDVELQSGSNNLFYQDNRFQDRVQFTGEGGVITGLVFNPGLQSILAKKIR